MNIFILLIGVFRIVYGSVLVLCINILVIQDVEIAHILAVFGVNYENYGEFLLVWLISFKFWKIIRQLKLIYQGSDDSAAPTATTTKENLRALHEWHEKRKKIGAAIGFAVFTLKAIFQILSSNWDRAHWA